MLSQGYILNTYEILSVIGQGGFGIVYKGKHRELGVDVAIKEYFPSDLSVRRDGTVQPSTQEFQDPFEEGLDRFIREAKQLEKFRDCPNIVTCRDLFRANGTAYTIMEYVRGVTLSKLLEYRESQADPLTEEELLDLIVPLLRGLQKVHDSDICHRDLKPSNILVRRDDSIPVLIDFGAAKHEISKRTKSIAPYTDGYAAMEQIGEGEIGPWTDMYGLGAVMWRVVAGGNPSFSPPNPPTVQKRAFKIMQGRLDPLLSAKEVGRGRFSDKILQAIDDCLIINVSDRVQNCRQLTEQLRTDKSNTAVSENTTKLPGEDSSIDARVQSSWETIAVPENTDKSLKVLSEKGIRQRPKRKFWKNLGTVIVGSTVMFIVSLVMCAIVYGMVGAGGAFQPYSWNYSIPFRFLTIILGEIGPAWLAGKICLKMMPNRVASRYVLIGIMILLGIIAIMGNQLDMDTFRGTWEPPFWDAMENGIAPTWSYLLSTVLASLSIAKGGGLFNDDTRNDAESGIYFR